MLTAGSAFLMSPERYGTKHLWIVLTDPSPDTGDAVCVSIGTLYDWVEDRTTILNVGDHVFIKGPSAVFYKDAQVLNLKKVEREIASEQLPRLCAAKPSCSPELLTRVRAGLLESKHTRKGIKALCRTLWKREERPVSLAMSLLPDRSEEIKPHSKLDTAN